MEENLNPEISFVIATKNRENVLKSTLESIINQTNPKWEVLIIDDNGEDNTEKMVKSFGEPRFRYYLLPPEHGHGASCARNFGAVNARTDLVAIMDSDDLCYPNRVQVTLDNFKENPEADVFYGNIDVWEEDTDIIRERKTPFTEYSFERLREGNFITHPTITIKKQVLLDNPYNQYFKIAEDYELYSRLATQGKKFIWTKEKILKYRIHSGNISVGEEKSKLTDAYGLLARMIRGWIPFDQNIFNTIEEENENSHRRSN